jgi:uncharacterized protein YkwD
MQRHPLRITRHRGLVTATVVTAALALCTSSGSAANVKCHGASDRPGGTPTRVLVDATLCLLNSERRRHGLRSLRLSERLSAAAQAHSCEMVVHQYFDHVTPAGTTFSERIRATGYLATTRGWVIGENIMWGTLTLDTPTAAVRAWMRSPEHRANILYGPYREVGIGVEVGDPVGIGGPAGTYTTDFGDNDLLRLRAERGRRGKV